MGETNPVGIALGVVRGALRIMKIDPPPSMARFLDKAHEVARDTSFNPFESKEAGAGSTLPRTEEDLIAQGFKKNGAGVWESPAVQGPGAGAKPQSGGTVAEPSAAPSSKPASGAGPNGSANGTQTPNSSGHTEHFNFHEDGPELVAERGPDGEFHIQGNPPGASVAAEPPTVLKPEQPLAVTKPAEPTGTGTPTGPGQARITHDSGGAEAQPPAVIKGGEPPAVIKQADPPAVIKQAEPPAVIKPQELAVKPQEPVGGVRLTEEPTPAGLRPGAAGRVARPVNGAGALRTIMSTGAVTIATAHNARDLAHTHLAGHAGPSEADLLNRTSLDQAQIRDLGAKTNGDTAILESKGPKGKEAAANIRTVYARNNAAPTA
jgi:hypothetical protein